MTLPKLSVQVISDDNAIQASDCFQRMVEETPSSTGSMSVSSLDESNNYSPELQHQIKYQENKQQKKQQKPPKSTNSLPQVAKSITSKASTTSSSGGSGSASGFTTKSIYRDTYRPRSSSSSLRVVGRAKEQQKGRTTHTNTKMLLDDEISQILLEDIHSESIKAVLKSLGRFADIITTTPSPEHYSHSSHNSANNNELLRVQACEMGAPAAIVTLMRKWSNQKNIQVACFRVLIALTVLMGVEDAVEDASCTSSHLKIRKLLWMIGGVESILDSMIRFPQSRSVQFFGCNALLSLLPSGSETSDSNQKIQKWMGHRFIQQYKGVKVVISAMIHLEEDRAVQEAGCSVLLKLATFLHSGQDRKLLLESGAVSGFSIALESHPHDEDIQHYTTIFMNFMSDHHHDLH